MQKERATVKTHRASDKKQVVQLAGERLIGAVPQGSRDEVRIYIHTFRGRQIVNIRKYTLTRSGWVHTPIGIMLGDRIFHEFMALAAMAEERIQETTQAVASQVEP